MTYFDDNEDRIIYGRQRITDDDEPSSDVVCKRCGKAGLHWDDDGGGGWVLMESMYKVHTCKSVSPDVADDFEVIE